MSETRQLEKIDTVDLGRFVASNGIVTPGQPLKITTPPEQWSYAATAELSRPPAAEFILMQIQVMVTRGRVGIGCVLDVLSTFVEEVAVSASDHSQTANLTWTRDQKPKHIVVRNMAPGGKVSEVLVYPIDLVSLFSGSRGDTAAPAVLRPMANWSRYYSQHYDSLEERFYRSAGLTPCRSRRSCPGCMVSSYSCYQRTKCCGQSTFRASMSQILSWFFQIFYRRVMSSST